MATPEPEAYPWLPSAAVIDHLRVKNPTLDGPAVERARVAAADVVERNKRELFATVEDETTFVASPAVVEAGVLLAARLYARTGSPVGVASFGEFAQSVLRSDPDVALLLGIGRHAKPACG